MNTFLLDFIRQIAAGSSVALLAAILIVVIGTYVALVLTRK